MRKFRRLFSLASLSIMVSACAGTNRWDIVDDTPIQAAPAIATNGNAIFIAAVGEDNSLRVSTSLTPQTWINSTVNGSSGVALDPKIGPELIAFDNELIVIAGGLDGELHRSATGIGSSWFSPFDTILPQGQVAGEIDATFTSRRYYVPTELSPRIENALHVVYETNEGCAYRVIVGTSVVAASDWSDCATARIASDGEGQVAILLVFTNQVYLFEALGAENWNAKQKSTPLRVSPSSVSELVRLGDDLHVLMTVDWLNHYIFEPTSNSFRGKRVTDHFTASERVRPSLTAYRGRLLATWARESDGIVAARWDIADPTEPWLYLGGIGEGHTEGRPTSIAGDIRPFSPSANVVYQDPHYGNDAFAAIIGRREGGKAEFINLSRAAMRRDIAREFDIYDNIASGNDVICDMPVSYKGKLWDDERAIVTEIGFSLWAFPNWMIENQFGDFVTWMCGDGEVWNDDNRACDRNDLPVVVQPFGGLFICAGAWIRDEDLMFNVWEETGHYKAIAFGFGSQNGTPGSIPRANDAYGIPVSALVHGRSLFEKDNNCPAAEVLPSNRCRGFTGRSGNYDSTGPEHSFLYFVHDYMSRGDEVRNMISEDLAVGHTLLSAKYSWTREHIFRGVEFGEDYHKR